MSGRFIVLEGIEGVGKSTQLQLAREHLEDRGLEVVVTREPGGTALAERIRDVVIAPLRDEPMPPIAELLLMFAARAAHVENLVRPALARGAWVLCDRFVDATWAYQGAGRGIPDAEIAALEALVLRGLRPDLVLLLDAPVALALGRARSRRAEADRFEQERVEFFSRVRDAYLARARREPLRYAVIDAGGDVDAVAAGVTGAIDAALGRWRAA